MSRKGDNPERHLPVGRPKGAKNRSTLVKEALKGQFEDLLATEGKKVFMAVVEKAKDGDMTAAKLLLDRILPVTKAVDINAGELSKGGITINIESLSANISEPDSQPIDIEDGEYEEVNQEEKL